MSSNDTKVITEVAIGLNLIWDIIDRVKANTGVVITPENIGAYITSREAEKDRVNAILGVGAGSK